MCPFPELTLHFEVQPSTFLPPHLLLFPCLLDVPSDGLTSELLHSLFPHAGCPPPPFLHGFFSSAAQVSARIHPIREAFLDHCQRQLFFCHFVNHLSCFLSFHSTCHHLMFFIYVSVNCLSSPNQNVGSVRANTSSLLFSAESPLPGTEPAIVSIQKMLSE